ncbi:MAG: amino acid adenylation domain-containing protein, partial [Gammaproteobacteria bacterium]|nr:amino acid adenylation domain-containing protein [Gammaproteobacteria bacterium]
MLEEYIQPESEGDSQPPEESQPHLIVLSARNEDRLRAYVQKMLDFLAGRRESKDQHQSPNPEPTLAEMAYTLQVGREAMVDRLAFVVENHDQLLQCLTAFLEKPDHQAYGITIFRGNTEQSKHDTVVLAGRVGQDMLRKSIDERDWETLAFLWTKGVTIPWQQLYGPNPPRRISLPTYPFERKRYWLPDKGTGLSDLIGNEAKGRASLRKKPDDGPISFDIDVVKTKEENIRDYLVRLLSQVLKIPEADIKLDRAFYDYGLDSIIGMQVRRKLEEDFDLEITGREMLEYSTLQSLAGLLATKIDDLVLMEHTKADSATTVPTQPVEMPLSEGQKGLWLLQKITPQMSAHNVPIALRFWQPLKPEVWQQACGYLLAHHPILQTVIHPENGQPVQVIDATQPLFFEQEDITELAADAVIPYLKTKAQEPFDLETGPLLRVQLFTRSEAEYILLLTVHHIIFDGTSAVVLIKTLLETFQVLLQGQEPPVPVSTQATYNDFVTWEQELLAGDKGRRHLAYWQTQLSGDLPVLSLPLDSPRPSLQRFEGDIYQVTLDPDLTQKVRALAESGRVSLAVLFLSIFKLLLYRYTGQEDILIGMPTVGRPQRRFEETMGYFINMVVIRSQVQGNTSFMAYLKALHLIMIDALDHAAYPFPKLVAGLNVKRDPAMSPLFQVSYAFQNFIPSTELKALESYGTEAATYEFIDEIQAAGEFDLALEILDVEDSYLLKLKYNSGLFHQPTIERMMKHYTQLIAEIVASPEKTISQYELLLADEKQKILVEWNNTHVDYPTDPCLHQLFEAQVERTPDAVAVVFADQQLTYSELNIRANQLAHYLQSLGVGPETLVGICLERSLKMVIGLLGILKAGAAYVPLDPAYPQDRLSFMLQDAQISVLLTQVGLVSNLSTPQVQLIDLDTDQDTIVKSGSDNPYSTVLAGNLIYVMYTSGSTGTPKATMLSHQGICNRLLWMVDQFNITPTDVVLHKASLNFDASVWEIFLPMISGGRLVVAQVNEELDSPALVQRLRQELVTTLHFVPPMLQRFLDVPEVEHCTTIRRVWSGGDVLPVSLQEKFFVRLGADLYNGLGPTETSINATYWLCRREERSRRVPIGQPNANYRIYLLDLDLQPVPIGITGELYIGGVGVSRGYLNRPGLTATRFIPNPAGTTPGDRLYRTGDLARYRSDGMLEFAGRADNQVKLNGIRIEPGEIEVILDQHPDVAKNVVVMREDQPDDRRLVAYVVTGNQMIEHSELITNLREFLQSKLPLHMIPSSFMMLDAFPLTPNGKLDRQALPVPARISIQDYVPTQTPAELTLAEIWQEVLGTDRVGRYNNFFGLGGHSLLATQVISRVRQAFQIELPLRSLFEKPTIAGLAEVVAQAKQVSLPSIEPVSRTEDLPLSFAQQRLWFLDQLEGLNPVYNMPAALNLNGYLDISALARSLNKIVQRHEVLRTAIQSVAGQAKQVIAPTVSVPLSVFDLQQLPIALQSAEVQRLTQAEAIAPFDLSQDPMIRARLLVLAPTDFVLLVTMHHIAADGWSLGILIQEVSQLYSAFVQGQPSPLPDLAVQYADFALWQRNWFQGEVLQEQLSYWQEQLAHLPALLELPTDRPRPPVQTFRGRYFPFSIPQPLSQALQQLSLQSQTTLFMTLLAAFKVLLMRYSGQTDIAVGSPIANRTQREIENLIGFFINTLVLRSDLAENSSFNELLSQVRQTTLAAYRHQDLPFEMLVEALQPERSLSHSPLFQVMFVLQNTPSAAVNWPDLSLSPVEPEVGIAKFDLTLFITETEQGLQGTWEYNTDLFDPLTIERMTTHFQQLLSGIVANPDQPITDLPILTEAERDQLLIDWNDTDTDYPVDLCLHQLFETQVEQTPEAVALVFEQEQVTYHQLNQRANQLAHHLQSLGIGPEVLVGIHMERSLEMVIGLLGILKAGGAYVPLDPGYPSERLAFMASDACLAWILSHSSLMSQLELAGDSEPPTILCLDLLSDRLSRKPTHNPASRSTPDNLAYVIFTSGSTGRPKGTLIPHQGLTNYLSWCLETYHLEQGSGAPVNTALGFDATVTSLLSPLLAGKKIVLLPEIGEIEALNKALQENNDFSLVKITPAHLELLNQLGHNGSGTHSFIIGGEALLGQQVLARRQQNAKIRLVNEYGPTETVVGCCVYDVPLDFDSNGPVPIGQPIANTRLYILDHQLKPVPVGVGGELFIGGIQLARGYQNRPALTAAKFIPDPFRSIGEEEGSRLYKTGDLARYLPDGNIEFLRRLDHQVKIRGYRIELDEIETVLSQHPDVKEIVVIAREDQSGQKQLVAYVIGNQDSVNSEQDSVGSEQYSVADNLQGKDHQLFTDNRSLFTDLRRFLQTKLPDYMIPATFVSLNNFPLTPNGKVDRRALPDPDFTAGVSTGYVAPGTPTEATLAAIWADILGVSQVGIHDDFFELGGHSLLATQVVARIRDMFQIELPLRDLFERPTIAQLADRVSQAQEPARPPIQPMEHKGDLPLSFAQQRLWFLDHLEGPRATYNIPGAIRLTGSLNIRALQQSFTEIIRRHESLRTTFLTTDGQAQQIIHSEPTFVLPVIDLQHLSSMEQTQCISPLAFAEAQRPFDLSSNLMLRAILVQQDQDDFVLLVTMHHIASDGWSMGVLIQEVSALYAAFVQGRPSPLPDLTVQYADFALWQRDWFQGEVLQAQLSYWQQQLAHLPALLELPTDRPRPPVQTFQGRHFHFSIPHPLSQALQQLGLQTQTTLFMTLLAAFKVLLRRYSGQTDIVVGSPIANRTQRKIENLIGFFVNTLILRSNLADNPSFKELLSQVRQTTLEAYRHQDLPFEMLVEALQPERSLSHSPLFQVMFVLQNAPNASLNWPDLSLSPVETETAIAKFDLTLSITETDQGLQGTWEYNTDLFEPLTIERMTTHFQQLLSGIVDNPNQTITRLPLLAKAERDQLLVEWNDTQVDFPQDLCLHQLFEAQIERTPEAIALVFEDEHLTYRELNRRANQLAHYLQSLGVGPEVLVGIHMERSLEMVIALYGILKAGGAYVPLDPTYPQERLAFMFADAQTSIVLTQSHLAAQLPSSVDHIIALDEWMPIPATGIENPQQSVAAHNLAYVIYTSGSTGQPKGAMNTHRAIVNRLLWMQAEYQLIPADTILQKTPFSFDVSVWEFFWPLLVGAKLGVAQPEGHKDPLYLVDTIRQWHITTIHFVPSMLQAFLEAEVEVCHSLHRVICSGEALPLTLQERFFSKSQAELHNLYGPTEAAVDVTYWACQPDTRLSTVPIGRPVANTQIYLLDQILQPVPVGVPGELHIGGVQVARGYHNRPDLTREKFIANPFGEGYLYKTGDLARYLPESHPLSEGSEPPVIEYLGRTDHQVKIRGFRIELGEIETVLSQHPDVRETVVLAGEDQLSQKQLVAYVVSKSLHDQASVSNEQASRADNLQGEDHQLFTDNRSLFTDLRRFLQTKLPDYMVPVAFVSLDSFPLTPNGKIDRRALPAPDFTAGVSAGYVAPGTPTEATLAAIWTDTLGVPQVGIHDDFFELGGHSLLAIRLMAQIQTVLRAKLPLQRLFTAPTVAGLAAQIETLPENQASELSDHALPGVVPAPADRYEPFPLTDVQQAYWLGRSQTFVLGQVATHGYLEIEISNLDLARLEWAWQQLIERHDMLRMIIRADGQQQILETVPVYEVEITDLRGQSDRIIEARLETIRKELSHQMLATDQWPLFEIRATRLTDSHTRLHLSFDALLADGWGFQILVREWYQLYHNPEAALPVLELSFRDYVLTEQRLLESTLYQQAQAYWFGRLDDFAPAPALPLAQDPETISRPEFRRRQGQLGPEQWQALKQRAGQAGLTPSALLLAAFAEVLTYWSKNPRFTVNLTLFNRLPLHPQVNDIVGDFTSLTLLEVDNGGGQSFKERSQRLQHQLWQDLDHRYVSGVRVLRELSRRQGQQVLMPVVFTSTLGLETNEADDVDQNEWGEVIYGISQTPQVWLDHQVMEQQGMLIFNWDAVEALFPAGLLDDMFNAYCTLLDRLATSDDLWQQAGSQLLPAAQLVQRATVNDTAAPISEEMLHTLFCAQVEARTDDLAVISPARTLTYQELYEQATQVGHWLRAHQAQPNTLVAVVMEKGWEQVVAVLGSLMSGAAYLPVDPDLPAERRNYLLEQGEVELVLTQSRFNQTFDWPERIPASNRLSVDTPAELAGVSTDPLEPVQNPTDLAYVIYTSGSTGQPKGVMIDHRGAVNTIVDLNDRFQIGPDDRVLALSALNFDLSVYDIFGTLAAGGTIIMPTPDGRRDPAHWVELMTAHRVTLWNSVPALMQMLVEYLAGSPSSTSLRLVWLSGDWIPITLPDQIWTLFPEAQLISMGGATEASIWSILYPIEAVDPTWSSIPYGKPMLNQHFQVLNELMGPCPVWVPGEIYIGGIGLAQGYWRDEEKTQAHFISHPETGERLYKTGDLGRYLPDGNIEFLGREDFQVKIRGHRIELGEIEAALVRHPDVQEAVASVVGEPRGDRHLAAYLVLASDGNGSNGQPIDQAAYGLEAMKGVLTDPMARLKFKLNQPGIRSLDPQRSSIILHQPPVNEPAYIARQSYRQFMAEPIPFEQFGPLLACLMPQIFANTVLPKYRYGSAGSLYPVQTYLYIKPDRVVGVAGGTYYYHPLEHRLVLLSAEAQLNREVHGGVNRKVFDQSAFSLFLVGELAAIEPMYGPMARDFCLLEAGYISQLLMEVAPTYEIGLCPIGGLDFEPIRDDFELSDSQELLHSFLGGLISPLQIETLPQPESKPRSWEEEARAYLAQYLPAYMIPSLYVTLETLPLTSNGKVDRNSLPTPDLPALIETDFVPARTATEKTLAAIWADILRVSQVGIHDDFFELGGHSVMATQVVARIRQTMQVELPLHQIFEQSTIAQLVDSLNQAQPQAPHYPIQPVDRNTQLPLSFNQQGLWFLDQLAGQTVAYHLPLAVRLTGSFDITAFNQSLTEIIRRHESLRTIFTTVDDVVYQVIQPAPDFKIPIIDLQHLTKPQQADTIAHIRQIEAQRPFDLSQDLMLRAALLHLGSMVGVGRDVSRPSEQDFILLMTIHHIAYDGWSNTIFTQELSTLYRAFRQGTSPDLPKLAVQYADFAYWQRQWLQDEHQSAEALTYWERQLADLPPFLALPTDHPRPAVQTYRGGAVTFTLPKSLTQELHQISLQFGTTLFMTLLASFKVLLMRYSGQTDIVVDTPIANRPRTELEPLIGFFVNDLLLRTNLVGNPPFDKLLEQVRQMTLEAYQYQDVPLDLLLEILQPERDLSHTSLFQVMFILQNIPAPTVTDLPDLTITPLPPETGASKFDLTLEMAESDAGLTGTWEYNTDLFEPDTIERLSRHFQQMLAGIVDNPHQYIMQLPLLSELEHHQLLVDYNATATDYGLGISFDDTCLHHLFEAQVNRTPDAVAFICGDEHITYGRLNQRANHLAHYLQEQGVDPETFVALYLPRSIEMVVGLLGILKAGGAYLPLDPTYPSDRLTFMLEDTRASSLITTHALTGTLPFSGTTLRLDYDWPTIARYPHHNPDSRATADNLAHIIYTSGSTGVPKGVMGTHRNVVSRLFWTWADFPMEPTDVYCQKTSLSFIDSICELHWGLSVGVPTVIISEAQVLDPNQFIQIVAQHHISRVIVVPSFLRTLLETQPDLKTLLAHVNYWDCGGEDLSPELVNLFYQKQLPGTLRNAYGSSEVTGDATYYDIPPSFSHPSIPIGQPIDNVQTYILDQALNPTPPGVPGELHLAGSGLARGYLNAPALTAKKFIPNPFVKNEDVGHPSVLYKTGDLVRYVLADTDQPVIEYLGRIDQQVKIRGMRVDLGEIEAALRQYPQIADSVVLVREVQPGQDRLVAYIVRDQSTVASEQWAVNSEQWAVDSSQTNTKLSTDNGSLLTELQQFLKSKLPEYMVPSAFVTVDAFPLLPNGKIDQEALPLPDSSHLALDTAYTPPQTSTEKELAAIWVDVLAIDKVGLHDNFFDLGGHSLVATQVVARIRQTLQVELPLQKIFEHSTISQLAHSVSQVQKPARPPIQRVSRTDMLPLSFAQQRLWFLDQLEGPSATYNIPGAVRLTGSLNIPALRQSFTKIIHHHESLRTTFLTVEGQPQQVIHSAPTFVLPLVDLQHLPPTKQTRLIMALAGAEAQLPFDLSSDLMLRAILVQHEPDAFVLFTTMHHIAADGWSMEVLVQELSTLYAAFDQGKPSPLPDLTIQYADFAQWQRDWFQGEVLQEQLTYWQRQLANLPALLELPTDRPRPSVQTFRGRQFHFLMPQPLSQALQQLSLQSQTTLFMTLLAAFKVLLMRYSGQTDIVVGSPIANRTQRELENLIGFFVNTLALRSDLRGNPSFKELLNQVRQTTLAGYRHQDLPFEMLVEALQPERSLSHSPLFQVMFVLPNAPNTAPIGRSDLTLSPFETEAVIAKFDLTLFITETEQGLHGAWEYNTDLFDTTTIERMTTHFQTLLQAIVANPEQPINAIRLLTKTENHQLLVEWNDTQTDYPTDQCLHHLFEAQVERTPEAIALVFEEEHLTYRQLNRRANQLAHHLQSLGVGPEVLVGVHMERSIEMVIALYGILKSGGAYVPLDPTYPQERLAFMFADAQTSIVLTQSHLAAQLPSQIDHIIALDEEWSAITSANIDNPPQSVTAHNPAYVIYTSGSTGQPKGVQLEHQSVVNFLLSMAQTPGLKQSDRLLAVTTISFDIAVLELFLPLSVGASVEIVSQSVTTDGQRLLEKLPSATVMQATPATWQMLLAAGWSKSPHLKILCGGEALAKPLAKQLLRQGQTVWNMYGPTETTIWSAIKNVENSPGIIGAEAIGRPIANTQLYILDDDYQPTPVGVAGQLYIGGDGLARGYRNRPDLTSEVFVPNPFGEGRLYSTGDLARYLPDGNIEFLGRTGHQVKIRGFRIELGEIETVLSQHPDVRETVVIAREDQSGQKQLVAYVIAQQSTVNSEQWTVTGEQDAVSSNQTNGKLLTDNRSLLTDLWRFVQVKLPDYMIPSAFMILDNFPLTPSGKIDRRMLPDPDFTAGVSAGYVAPNTPTEATLAAIWTDILSVPHVGIHDNFFELGGHSLIATQVASRIRATFQVELPLRSLFEQPTIFGLANTLSQARQSALPPIRPVPREGVLPLSFAQQRLWVLDQLEGPNAVYNIPSAIKLTGELNFPALQQSFAEIMRRHESLRTTFALVNGQGTTHQVQQIVHPAPDFILPIIDLQHLTPAQQAPLVNQLITTETRRPFDLANDLMFRATLLQLGPSEAVLVVTMHHIASDGWSLGVAIQEFGELYPAFAAGQPSPLADLAIQYADFAVWQRHWLSGQVLERQVAYWQQHLAQAPTRLALPTDYPRPQVQTVNGRGESFELSVDLTNHLQALSQQHNTSLFMILHAAFTMLLAHYSHQKDLIIGTTIANRHQQDIEPLIGFFVNVLPIRTNLSGDPDFLTLLAQVRYTMLQAYAHQDIPLDKLLEELNVERLPGYAPLVQVAFAFQNFPVPQLELEGLSMSPIEFEVNTAQTDIALFMGEDADRLVGAVEYNSDLFEARTMAWLVADFNKLLDTIVSAPEQRMSTLWQTSGIQRPPWLEKTSPAQGLDLADMLDRTNLTRGQLHLWLGQQLHPETSLYTLACAAMILGDVQFTHFQNAVQTLVNSCDALRTIIEVVDGIPQQRVLDELHYALAYYDFSQLPAVDEELERWLQNQYELPLDLARYSFEYALIKVSKQKYIWFLKQHHILSDGWSQDAVVLPLVAQLYAQSLQGTLERQIDIPAFQQYVADERTYRQSNRYRKAQAFWEQKLSEVMEPLNFYGRVAQQDIAPGQRFLSDLGQERTQAIKAIAGQENIGIPGLFGAVLYTYLARISGVQKISLGMPFHNRRKKIHKEMIGLVVEMLPLRVSLEAADTFLSLAKKINTEINQAIRYGQVGATNPVHGKHYEVELNYVPFFPTEFNGQPTIREWYYSGYQVESLGLQILDYLTTETIVLAFDLRQDIFDEDSFPLVRNHFL